jgi:hypothetical protein
MVELYLHSSYVFMAWRLTIKHRDNFTFTFTITMILWDGVDWVDLAQDRDHWRALVNTVMNLRVP